MKNYCAKGECEKKDLIAEVKRLRRDCAELYQVIGTLIEPHGDLSADPQCIKALDNASSAANGFPRRHDDLLPFTPILSSEQGEVK